jgi:hypothetical protein
VPPCVKRVKTARSRTPSTPDGLLVERIDPAIETARYTAEVLAAASGLDEEGVGLLEEDLRSPCTEEIAVFCAFARTVDAARERIVVLDTAPPPATRCSCSTPHNQREVQRTNADVPARSHTCLHVCATPTSHACSSSRSPNPHPSTKPTACKQTSAEQASSRTAGSSTPP